MLRNYFLINVALISAAGFLGYEVYEFQSKPMNIPAKIAKKQNAAENKEKAEINPAEKKTDVSSFHVIVQKDLFRPNRTEPKMDELKSGIPAAPPPRLIGTVITDDGAKAYIEDSLTKTTKAVTVKESVGGFVVQEIKENSVILLRGGEKIEVKIIQVQTIEPAGKKPSMPMPQNIAGPSPVQQPIQPPAQPPLMKVPPLHALPPQLPVPPAAPQPILKPVK